MKSTLQQDFLVFRTEMGVKLDYLTAEVKNMRDGTVAKIASLERDKADCKEVEMLQKRVNVDIESRIRALERNQDEDNGKSEGSSLSWGAVVTIVGLVIGVLTLLAYIHFHA